MQFVKGGSSLVKSILAWVTDNVWVVSIFTGVLGALLTAAFNKKRELYIKIAEKKSQCYSQYLHALISLNGKIDKDFYFAKTQVILYGSKGVLEKLANAEKYGISMQDVEGQNRFVELVTEMKKDVEKPNVQRVKSEDMNAHIPDILNLRDTKGANNEYKAP
jgi:hypothetical protein